MNPLNVKSAINFIKISLEIIFISVFLYSSFFLNNNYGLFLRIWILTILIFILFVIQSIRLNKDNLKNLLNPVIIFFIIFSAAQTTKNICMLGEPYFLISEIIHYTMVLFVLAYNFKKDRFIDTGLILFIIYSFRIFDTSLFNNEFVLLHALSLVLALLWLEDIYVKKYSLPVVKSIFIPAIILVIIAIFSTIKAACPYNSLTQTMVMLNFIFIAFLIANHTSDINQIKLFIFSLFLIGSILLVLIANEILHKFLNGGIYGALSRIWINIRAPFRIHPNSLAGYFAALLCLIIGDTSSYKGKILKGCKALSIIIMSAILLLTYSRLGILSFILAISILFWLRYKESSGFIKNRLLYIFLIIVFFAGLIFLSPIKQNLFTRIYNFHSSSQTFYSCKNSLKAIKDNPLFGLGLDNYYILSKYAKEQIFKACGDSIGMAFIHNVISTPSHSLYVGIAFGLGIIGLLAFIWLLINVIVYFIKLNKYILYKRYERGLLQGIFAAFLTVIIYGILAMTFHLTILPAFFWVFIGLIISIGNIVNFNDSYEFKLWRFFVVLFVIFLFSICFIISPVIAEKRYTSALKSFNSGELNKAIIAINQAKIFMPIDPKFYELSAEIKVSQGLLDEAIGYYKQALSLRRDFAFYHTKLGQLYWQKKMYPYALIEFNTAIDLDKYGVCYQEHYSDLGNFYKEMGDREQAIAQFKMALQIEPELSSNVNWSGLGYLNEILNQIRKDYLIFKDKSPLAAEQILYNLRYILMSDKKNGSVD